jgi:hypothetical protein
MPSSSLNTASPRSSTKLRKRAGSRVTIVGAVNWGNSAIDSFSLWLRTARGSLNTRAPARLATSSR